jgi:4-amino-4-deoxychorismate lyase
MFPLFESIKIKDGEIFHLDLHQKRMDESYYQFYEKANIHHLQEILTSHKIFNKGLFKCRVSYGRDKTKIEIDAYQRKEIKSLRIVKCDELNYELKFTDRKIFNRLKDQNSDVDEIIILKNGFISDTSFSNLIFWNGKEWHTPSRPLLKGVQRKFFLTRNMINEVEIGVSDLGKYEKIGLINAMMDFDDMPIIDIKQIQF